MPWRRWHNLLLHLEYSDSLRNVTQNEVNISTSTNLITDTVEGKYCLELKEKHKKNVWKHILQRLFKNSQLKIKETNDIRFAGSFFCHNSRRSWYTCTAVGMQYPCDDGLHWGEVVHNWAALQPSELWIHAGSCEEAGASSRIVPWISRLESVLVFAGT